MIGGVAPTRVVLADDHRLFREGLAQILAAEEDILVLAQVSSGREVLQQIEAQSVDVVVMDITMPDMDGVEATREISERHPEVAVLILSAHDDRDSLFSTIQAGACGYLLKDTEPEEFAKAIRVVADGGSVVSPYMTPHLLQSIRDMGYQPAEAERRRLHLSGREIEVLKQLATPKTPAQIGRDLFISTKTVQNHMSNLYRKLGVTNRAEAVFKAAELGLLPKS